MMFKKFRILALIYSFTVIVVSISLLSNDLRAQTIELIEQQVLSKHKHDIKGLNNPRHTLMSADGRFMYVVSADDDGLAIFNVNDNFDLEYLEFSTSTASTKWAAGAIRLASSTNGNQVFLVSFYDSALVTFEKDQDGLLRYKNRISDDIEWFNLKGEESKLLEEKDIHGLFGAYDIAVAPDNKQMIVAGSVSNSISIFNLNTAGELTLERVIRDTDNKEHLLKSAVSVKISSDNNSVFVASYEENGITIFTRSAKGILEFSQNLTNNDVGTDKLISPHSIELSSDNQFIYVACEQAIIVFQKTETTFSHFQTINNSDIEGGLKGATDIAFTKDENFAFVTSEIDNALVTFKRTPDGKLTFDSAIKTPNLEGASSVNVSPNGKHLIVTSGKGGNSLSTYKINITK